MLIWTSLGFEHEFFSLHCQRLIHSTTKAVYKLRLYILNIFALLIYEDDSTIVYKTKSLDGTNPNTNPKTN